MRVEQAAVGRVRLVDLLQVAGLLLELDKVGDTWNVARLALAKRHFMQALVLPTSKEDVFALRFRAFISLLCSYL